MIAHRVLLAAGILAAVMLGSLWRGLDPRENLGEVALTMVAFGIGAAFRSSPSGSVARSLVALGGRLMEPAKAAKSCSAEYWLQSASWWRQASTRGWRRFWLMLRLAGSRVSPPSSERLAIATASHF